MVTRCHYITSATCELNVSTKKMSQCGGDADVDAALKLADELMEKESQEKKAKRNGKEMVFHLLSYR